LAKLLLAFYVFSLLFMEAHAKFPVGSALSGLKTGFLQTLHAASYCRKIFTNRIGIRMAARAIPQAIIRDIRRLIAELDKENIRSVQMLFAANKSLRDEEGDDNIQSCVAHEIISKNQNDDFPTFFTHETLNALFTDKRRPLLDNRRFQNFAKIHDSFLKSYKYGLTRRASRRQASPRN
jgi:hypothetical protein